MIKKIFELKADDWRKGLSFQRYSPVGGLFWQATYFDPFYYQDVLYPYFAPQ
jgi:hypothetical protein